MSDEQPEPRKVGRMEQGVLDKFESPGWRTVDFQQLGPDGTEVLAVLIFHLCPVCSACIPLGSVEDPIPDWHRDHHLAEAQALDEVRDALRHLLSLAGIPQPEED